LPFGKEVTRRSGSAGRG